MAEVLDCGEHHAHDRSCYRDHAAEERRHIEWCRAQCEAGRHAGMGTRVGVALKMDPAWSYCPLCGSRVR